MAAIYLLRHGKASFGAADYDRLDPLGVRQAECLGRALREAGVREPLCLSGSLRRHRETLAACLAAMGVAAEPSVDARWNEFDHEAILRAASPDGLATASQAIALGADGRAFQRLLESALARWMDGGHEADYAEPWAAFRARIGAALGELVAALPSGRDALVATSGGPIAVALQQVLSLADAQVLPLNRVIANASYTRLVAGRPPRLASFNVHAHLQADGRDLLTYR